MIMFYFYMNKPFLITLWSSLSAILSIVSSSSRTDHWCCMDTCDLFKSEIVSNKFLFTFFSSSISILWFLLTLDSSETCWTRKSICFCCDVSMSFIEPSLSRAEFEFSNPKTWFVWIKTSKRKQIAKANVCPITVPTYTQFLIFFICDNRSLIIGRPFYSYATSFHLNAYTE